jgi:hypothetical protein
MDISLSDDDLFDMWVTDNGNEDITLPWLSVS